jgi:hypothetical protein
MLLHAINITQAVPEMSTNIPQKKIRTIYSHEIPILPPCLALNPPARPTPNPKLYPSRWYASFTSKSRGLKPFFRTPILGRVGRGSPVDFKEHMWFVMHINEKKRVFFLLRGSFPILNNTHMCLVSQYIWLIAMINTGIISGENHLFSTSSNGKSHKFSWEKYRVI